MAQSFLVGMHNNKTTTATTATATYNNINKNKTIVAHLGTSFAT